MKVFMTVCKIGPLTVFECTERKNSEKKALCMSGGDRGKIDQAPW